MEEPTSTPPSPPGKKEKLFKNKWFRIGFIGMAGLIMIIWVATWISRP